VRIGLDDPDVWKAMNQAIESGWARTRELPWANGGLVIVDDIDGWVRIEVTQPLSPEPVIMPTPPLAPGERVVAEYRAHPHPDVPSTVQDARREQEVAEAGPFGWRSPLPERPVPGPDAPSGPELGYARQQGRLSVFRTGTGVYVFDPDPAHLRFTTRVGRWHRLHAGDCLFDLSDVELDADVDLWERVTRRPLQWRWTGYDSGTWE
jgi:hypothetical protein